MSEKEIKKEIKKEMEVIEIIEKYLNKINGSKTVKDLQQLFTRLEITKKIMIESYEIAEYVKRNEEHKKRFAATEITNSLSAIILPKFKAFLEAEFKIDLPI